MPKILAILAFIPLVDVDQRPLARLGMAMSP
jgi:hypothetical protein